MTDRLKKQWFAALALATLAATSSIADTGAEGILPPEIPWDGQSRQLVVSADDPWITPSEASGLKTSPSYDETITWLQRLTAASRDLRMVSIGKSPEGRDIWMVIASKERAFTPDKAARSKKPLLLAHAGIHSGEIDGKDAGMMLLRDMTVGRRKSDLLDLVNFLFVPIFSVDAHERSSDFNRINQRGPENMGWRTNARNLNLNRDYTKLDTGEMRAMVRTINEWKPDLYLDLHVTDGADYQYDATFGWNGQHANSPAAAKWLDDHFRPDVDAALTEMGHIPGPLIFAANGMDMYGGYVEWTATQRFSTGWGDARHLPSVLLENHSLKPYDQRVLGTYVFLESAIRTLGANHAELAAAVESDETRSLDDVPFSWGPATEQPPIVEFLGVRSERYLSEISGGVEVAWTGEPETIEIPLIRFTTVSSSAKAPKAYWIPSAWREVIEILDLQGIRMERITADREVDVTMYRLKDPKVDEEPFEGHVRVSAEAETETSRELFRAGSVRVPIDQPLGVLAMVLLEPASPDSLFQWGFFHSILSRTEYAEGYVMEPTARKMLEADADLRAEFEQKLASDSEFAGSSSDRLQWFYEKTPYFDEKWMLYPVGREE